MKNLKTFLLLFAFTVITVGSTSYIHERDSFDSVKVSGITQVVLNNEVAECRDAIAQPTASQLAWQEQQREVVTSFTIFNAVQAQTDTAVVAPGGGGVDKTAVWTGVIVILLPAIWTFLVRIFPTQTKKWDFIGNFINAIPNNKSGGGVH